MKKKIFSTKGIIVIVLLVVAVILGVVYWPKESKAPETSSTSSSTANDSGALTVATSTAWQVYHSTQYGFTFSYPPNWTITATQPAGALTNFAGNYDLKTGSIPEGGAEIDAMKTTLYGSLDDVINTEVPASTVTSKGTISVANVSCEEVFYDGMLPAGQSSKNIAVYCLKGTTLAKIYLVYHADDSNGSNDVSTFNRILESVTLSK